MTTAFKHLDTAALPDEWSADHFGNLVDFKLDKTPPRASPVYWKEGKYPWVSISDMTPHGIVTETAEKVSQEAYDTDFRGKLVPEGSLLMAIRPMRNKWASCSTNGHLHFNAELLNLDESLWDYVIVHEMLHFYVPNHGKLWKSLMRAHLGNDEAMESKLGKYE